MLYTLKNEELTLTFSDVGAELISVQHEGENEKCEFLWQGDPTLWGKHAPLLFPICGRLKNGQYTLGGVSYSMELHGFARHLPYTAEQLDDTGIRFTLSSDETTKSEYPFDFVFSVLYRLIGCKVTVSVNIRNTGKESMPATFGAHPGFCVPFDGGRFEDYSLVFGDVCSPNELIFSNAGFNTGKKKAFPLEHGKVLRLTHSLFDAEGVFLDRVSSSVTLKRENGKRAVTLEYPDMPYLGLWQPAGSNAPFVCIEPWCGLPDFEESAGELRQKNDMFLIAPGQEKTVGFAITFASVD